MVLRPLIHNLSALRPQISDLKLLPLIHWVLHPLVFKLHPLIDHWVLHPLVFLLRPLNLYLLSLPIFLLPHLLGL